MNFKAQILVTLLRIILTTWLVYEIYLEAGVYTAFAILLICVSVELQSVSIKAHLFSIQQIKKHLFD